MNYALRQLRTLCRRHPVRTKVVFVPSKQVGHMLSGALARSGQGWVNLRMRVVSDLARELAGPRLEAWGRERLKSDAEHLLVDELVEQHIRQTGSPLSILRPSRRNTKTFENTLQALRNARVRPVELRAAGKGDLADLLEAYEQAMEGGGFDKAALLEEAIRVARSRPPDPVVFAILDETPLTALEVELVRALVRDAPLWRIGRASYGMPAPRNVAAHYFADQPLLEPSEEGVHPAGRIRSEGMRPEDAGRVHLKRCLGVEAEVRGVLRDVLDRGLAFDEVEIAYTAQAPYLAQLVSAAEELDLPAHFAEGISVHLTVPGQALLGYLEWIAGGFEPQVLSDLLRTRRIRLQKIEEIPAEVKSEHVASILDRLPLSRGHSGYEPVIDKRIRELRDEAAGSEDEDLARELQRTEAAWVVFQTLTGELPEDEDVTLEELAAVLEAFLKQCVTQEKRHLAAFQSTLERLADLEEVDYQAPLRELASRLYEMLSEHTVDAAAARPGALYVAPLDRAGYAGRRKLYVLGMDETSFPATPSEDPILLDDERADLSARLELRRDRPAAQTWQLIRLLGQARGEVTLTSSITALADGNERHDSAFFLQAAEQLTPDGHETYDFGPPWSVAGEEGVCLTDTEWYLAYRRHDLSQAVKAAFPTLQAGACAHGRRQEDAFTEFDGYVGRPVPYLVPGADGSTIFSSSRLETLASCPYQYFLRYALGVRPPEIQEDDPSRWLDPPSFGGLLHEVLRAFMEKITRRGERPCAEHEEELMDIAERYARRWRDEKVRAPNEVAFESDLKRLKEAARLFLSEESERTDATPIGFEVSFGMGKNGALDLPEPVAIDLGDGRSIRLRGTIDRIDLGSDGYEIWDYKSGSDGGFDDSDLLTKGLKLQWALYGYALEEMARRSDALEMKPVARSGYFFVSNKTHGKRLSAPPPPKEVLANELEPLFEMVGEGAFLKVHKQGRYSPCTYCDYQKVCKSEACRTKRAKRCLDGCDRENLPFVEHAERWLE